jgi:hypothetical protein
MQLTSVQWLPAGYLEVSRQMALPAQLEGRANNRQSCHHAQPGLEADLNIGARD